MQKLITDLHQLILDRHKAGISIGQIDIDTYRVRIKIMCERFNADHTPSTNPFDYTASVQIHNLLTHGTINSAHSPEYEVLPDLRKKILEAVEKALTLFTQVEKTKPETSILGETSTKQQKIRRWYQTSFGLGEQQLDLLHSFHSPQRIPLGYSFEEVLLCIRLYPVRVEHKKLCSTFSYPARLHPVLFIDIDENISRTDALRKAIFDMYMDLVKYQPPPSYS
jgi:hypothetical protein